MRIVINGETAHVTPELVEKYAVAAPRYTSYPTCPNWNPAWSETDFRRELELSNEKSRPLSLYFHIPFCEERCTFCACSTIATKKHGVAEGYVESLCREVELVSGIIDSKRGVEQIHLGGGTPTYLSSGQLCRLYEKILTHFSLAPDAEVSVEIDPRVTTPDQLLVLADLGFNRLSLGIQDFSEKVQKAIGRIQSREVTESLMKTARQLGFKSINCDLVYGLPKQEPASFHETLEATLELDPDRLSLFHFAHVPWMMPHQKAIDPADIPSSWQKVELFCDALRSFQDAGYVFIGLDHFARRDDELVKAFLNGDLHRNFQGYSTHAECDVLAFGITGISQLAGSYSQNVKRLKEYETLTAGGKLAASSGMALSEDDSIRQWVLNELFCRLRIDKAAFFWRYHRSFDDYFESEGERLAELTRDGVVRDFSDAFMVTPSGRFFLRNIASAFDAHLTPTATKKYSKVL